MKSKTKTIDYIFKLLLFKQHKTSQLKEKAIVKQLNKLGWLEFVTLCNAISKVIAKVSNK